MKRSIKFLIESKFYKKEITLKSCYNLLKSQGFDVIEFSSFEDTLIKELQLTEIIKYYNCFTYIGNSSKYIFIKSNLTDRDKIILLLHEEGHIYLEHTAYDDELIHNTSTWKEWQANMFYFTVSAVNKFCRHGIYLLSVILIIIIAVTATQEFKNQDTGGAVNVSTDYIKRILTEADEGKTEINSETVYYTEDSDEYHLYRLCSYLAYRDNVKEGSIEQSKKAKCCEECRTIQAKEYMLKNYGLPEFD